MKTLILMVLLLCSLVVPALAQNVEVPAFSWSRLSLGTGINYDFYSATDATPLAGVLKEWSIGAYGAYALTAPESAKVPALSLVGSSVFGLDTHVFRSSIGLRCALFNGGK